MAPSGLRVLVFPESLRTWTARSIERDIAATGTTAEAALDTLLKVIQAHVGFDMRHGLDPLSAFEAAPRLYWSAFAGASRFVPAIELPCEGRPAIRIDVATTPQHPILVRAAPAKIA